MSQNVALILLLLACPVGMCLAMWFMSRSESRNLRRIQPRHPAGEPAAVDAASAEVTRLQAEIDQLKAAERDAPPARPDRPGRRPPEG